MQLIPTATDAIEFILLSWDSLSHFLSATHIKRFFHELHQDGDWGGGGGGVGGGKGVVRGDTAYM
jgi:hypothetical protein